jgi:uncharacterized coiled-coil protein SlyX
VTVRYDAVNVMVLNEFLKEHKKVDEQQATIRQLETNAATQKATISELKSVVAQQQKGLELLSAQVREQAGKIQKVSAQLDLTKPSLGVAANNH